MIRNASRIIVPQDDFLQMRRPLFGAGAGQRLHARLVDGKIVRRAGIDDLTVVEHISIVRYFETHTDVLLDQQNRDSLRTHLRYDAKDLARNQWRQSLRGLVKNK